MPSVDELSEHESEVVSARHWVARKTVGE